jgi:hypothetical protein
MAMRKRIVLTAWTAMFAAVAVAVTCRGYYLLGTGYAIVGAVVSSGVAFVVWRAFFSVRRFPRLERTIALVLAGSVLTVYAFPAYVSPQWNWLIEEHRTERLTHAQLKAILQSNPKFARLRFSCKYEKCIHVHVYGTIDNESDLRGLRRAIYDICPQVGSGFLYWDVTIEDNGIRFSHKCDEEFIPAWGGRTYAGGDVIGGSERD